MAQIFNLSRTGLAAVPGDLAARGRVRSEYCRLTLADPVRLRDLVQEDLTHEA
jgi:hypothetical protein